MSPEEASAAVVDGKRVRMNYATGDGHHGEGRVYGYSIVPVLMIELPDGTKTTWRHDLCETIEDEPDTQPKCLVCSEPQDGTEERFCPQEQKFKSVCSFDHCIECGAFT